MTKAMDASLRPILPDDVDAVVRLCIEHAAFEQAVFCADGKIEDLSCALFATMPQLWGFVVEVDDVVVGYAACSRGFSTWQAARYLHIDCLCLARTHRRVGIGRQLMRAIARLAVQLGCATTSIGSSESSR